jgi:hypothetical protein
VPFDSGTRLHIRSVRFMPAFVLQTWRSMRQVHAAAGLLGGQLAGGANRVSWTVTVWESAHPRAMPKLIDWCDEAAVAHWEQPGAELPTPADAAQRLGREGRPSKVRHPTSAHERRGPTGRCRPVV